MSNSITILVTNHIIIPGGDFTAYWNPDIDDLGGFKGYDPKYAHKVLDQAVVLLVAEMSQKVKNYKKY